MLLLDLTRTYSGADPPDPRATMERIGDSRDNRPPTPPPAAAARGTLAVEPDWPFRGPSGGGRVDIAGVGGQNGAVETPREILEMMLGHLGFVFDVTEEETPDGLVLQVHTREAQRLIGREGRLLDDLQYLVNRLSSQSEDEGEHHRMTVDVEYHRVQARDELVEMVKRMADRVRRTGRPVMLEPLNSYNRRIVHNVLKDDPRVESSSPKGLMKFKRITLRLRRASRPERGGQGAAGGHGGGARPPVRRA